MAEALFGPDDGVAKALFEPDDGEAEAMFEPDDGVLKFDGGPPALLEPEAWAGEVASWNLQDPDPVGVNLDGRLPLSPTPGRLTCGISSLSTRDLGGT